jgi:hypothetical protein
VTTVHPRHGQHPVTNLLSLEIGADMSNTRLYPPPFRQPPGMSEGAYLTDQRRLFRVLLVIPRRAAILEDCRTLETMSFRAKELVRLNLRVVQPAVA